MKLRFRGGAGVEDRLRKDGDAFQRYNILAQ